jgi:plastocyanin
MARITAPRFVPRALAWAGVLALMTAAACGGGDSGGGGGSPTGPTPPSDPATTITITANGVSPRSLTVPAGTRVTFVNNDSRPHDMASNPHPEHTDCPEINQVGFLTTGQSRQTGNLNTRRTCGFHDHNRDTDTSLQGTITIQ